MNDSYADLPNGYEETIRNGMNALRHFGHGVSRGTGTKAENIARLADELRSADAVVVGAGAGLSTSAGFRYDGERFIRFMGDFCTEFKIPDMYIGGFVAMQQDPAVTWAYWSRFIYINRYMAPPEDTYGKLLGLLDGKDYFVITTNVDHCFQKAGIDKERLFYTQGDYGLWQCRSGRLKKTYDNEAAVKRMLLAQGFWFEHVMSPAGAVVERDSEMIKQYGERGAWRCEELDYKADWGELLPPVDSYGSTDFSRLTMNIPPGLIPYCPDNGEPVAMNLRADDSFVEDEGWHRASAAYAEFLYRHEGMRVLYLELGVGANTPVIIKYPFWNMVCRQPGATYACINLGEAYAPKEIEDRSICIDEDIRKVIDDVMRL